MWLEASDRIAVCCECYKGFFEAADAPRRLPTSSRDKMQRQKSRDPVDRMGVYKRYTDVLAKHRFERFSDSYKGRHVWRGMFTTVRPWFRD